MRIVYRIGGQEFVFPIEKDEIAIGRSPRNDLSINHVSVSRRHARMYRDGGAWKVEDLGSTNGTRLDDSGDLDRPLRGGDTIFVGEVGLRLVEEGSTPKPGPGSLLGGAFEAGAQTIYRSAVDFKGLAEGQPEAPGEEAPVSPERLQRLVAIVSEASKAILASESLDDVFQRMLDLVFKQLPVQRGFIMLWDDERGDLVARHSRSQTRMGAEKMQFSRTIAHKVYRDKVAVITRDAQADGRFAEGHSIAFLGIRSAMAAPLWNGDNVDGVICVDTTSLKSAFSDFDLDLLSAMGNHLAVAVEQFRLRDVAREKEKQDREMAVARQIQMDTFPKKMPALEGYDLAATSRPADETGGDTFDLIPLGDRSVMLLLGDATGHGIGPALSVTQVRSMLRVAMRLHADLDDAFRHINDQLSEDLADNRFVTAFLGVLEGEAHRVSYHSGGQGPLMHFRAATGTFEWRGASTIPLGFLPTRKMKPPEVVELAPGDILGLLTDGVFEAASPAGEMFGEERVERVVRDRRDGPSAGIVQAILDAVDGFSDTEPQADDITIVIVRRR